LFFSALNGVGALVLFSPTSLLDPPFSNESSLPLISLLLFFVFLLWLTPLCLVGGSFPCCPGTGNPPEGAGRPFSSSEAPLLSLGYGSVCSNFVFLVSAAVVVVVLFRLLVPFLAGAPLPFQWVVVFFFFFVFFLSRSVFTFCLILVWATALVVSRTRSCSVFGRGCTFGSHSRRGDFFWLGGGSSLLFLGNFRS